MGMIRETNIGMKKLPTKFFFKADKISNQIDSLMYMIEDARLDESENINILRFIELVEDAKLAINEALYISVES